MSPENAGGVRKSPKNGGCGRISPGNASGVRISPGGPCDAQNPLGSPAGVWFPPSNSGQVPISALCKVRNRSHFHETCEKAPRRTCGCMQNFHQTSQRNFIFTLRTANPFPQFSCVWCFLPSTSAGTVAPAWAAVCGVMRGYRSQCRARHAEHAATSLEPMRFRRRRKREESHDNYGF